GFRPKGTNVLSSVTADSCSLEELESARLGMTRVATFTRSHASATEASCQSSSRAGVCDPHRVVNTLPGAGSYPRPSTRNTHATSYRPLRRDGARRERPSSAIGPGFERREAGPQGSRPRPPRDPRRPHGYPPR